MSPLLIALFLLTAALYAAVGFGGGSTYNALLVLAGTDHRILPLVALSCNLLVVTGGVARFTRTGILGKRELRRLAPLLLASVPMAWLGGRLPIAELWFVGLLGCALLLSGLQLAQQTFNTRGRIEPTEPTEPRNLPTPLALLLGSTIGLLSGIVGIGGGIFLAPILYHLRFDSPRRIAAAASVFILVNSLAGLLGQWAKLADAALLQQAFPYWPLLIAVLLGGQIGSHCSAKLLPGSWIKRLTAVLMLYVAARLLGRWFTML